MAYIQAEDSALAVLALEDQPHRATNLEACFDLSYRHLTLPEHQQRFAQLGCFSGAFSIEAAAAIWRLSPAAARHKLDGLVRLSMVQREEGGYRLQRLLRDYARQKLTTEWPDRIEPTKRRHAAFYLRNRLYHPQILGTQNLGNVIEAPPSLDRSWLNIREAVHWALEHAPVLATSGAVLAHTERAAVLEMMRSRLIEAIRSSITQAPDRATAATLVEISGDLYLLLQDQAAALNCFVDAESAWSTVGNRLASSRATLRQAGVHLLNQALNETAEKMRTAQTLLAQSLPLAADDLPAARRLFYWFNLLYAALVRWEGLPQADVAHLAELAGQTGDVRLTARACHIYRLWQSVGEVDKAEQEALWSEYQLSGRCPPDVAHRFAARLSAARLSSIQTR
ncbi:hypothetical protein KFU94_33435 [Chloroflexi bacterium TSY]|nr:hypothetical protein [Chloroflexi bacterium TSY]